MIKKIGTTLFTLRSYTPIPLIFLAVYFAQLSWILSIVGVLVLLIGELMRIWAVGYAGGRTRTRFMSDSQVLVTSGPYAYSRNPLYLGNFLISAGICIIANVWWLMIVVPVAFFLQYLPIILSEENHLRQQCGEVYEDYLKVVPRLGFRFQAYGNRSDHYFSLSRALRSERRTFVAILLVIVLISGFSQLKTT